MEVRQKAESNPALGFAQVEQLRTGRGQGAG